VCRCLCVGTRQWRWSRGGGWQVWTRDGNGPRRRSRRGIPRNSSISPCSVTPSPAGNAAWSRGYPAREEIHPKTIFAFG
jgi:hypothetical protein